MVGPVFSLFLPDARVDYDLEGLWGPSGDSSGELSKMWHIDDIDKDDDDNNGDAMVRLFVLFSACTARIRLSCAAPESWCCPVLRRMRMIYC